MRNVINHALRFSTITYKFSKAAILSLKIAYIAQQKSLFLFLERQAHCEMEIEIALKIRIDNGEMLFFAGVGWVDGFHAHI